jgi:hypothetical protein
MAGTRADEPLHHRGREEETEEGAQSRDRRWLSLSKPVLVVAASGAVLLATLWHCVSDSPAWAARRPTALLESPRAREAYTCE